MEFKFDNLDPAAQIFAVIGTLGLMGWLAYCVVLVIRVLFRVPGDHRQ